MKSLILVVLLLAPYTCSGVTSLRLNVNSIELTNCSRGDVGLTDTSIQVQFRFTQGATVSEWSTLTGIDPKVGINKTLELPSLEDFISEGVQLRLLQLEHGGGICNCWKVEEAVVMSDSSYSADIIISGSFCSKINEGLGLTFCNGLAGEPRGFVSRAGRVTPGGSMLVECPQISLTLIPSLGPSLTVQDCSTARSALKLDVSYGLGVKSGFYNCDGPESFVEAIEFAMRTNTSGVYGPWIPLRLTQNGGAHTTLVNVRGYDVEVSLVSSQQTVVEQVVICGDDLLPANTSEVQFRWMNTADDFDFWTIFNVTVNFNGSEGGDICKIFDSNAPDSSWQEIRNGGTSCNDCPGISLPCDLAFSGLSRGSAMFALISNIALSEPLHLDNSVCVASSTHTFLPSSVNIMPTPTCLLTSSTSISQVPSFELPQSSVENSLATFQYDPCVSSVMKADTTATMKSTVDTTTSPVTINFLPTPSPTKTPTLVEAVMSAEPLEGSQLLRDNLEKLEPAVSLYLLIDILNRYNFTNRENQTSLIQNFIEIGEELVAGGLNGSLQDTRLAIGSPLLTIMDRLALQVFPSVGNFSSKTIAIQTEVIFAGTKDYITTINSTNYFEDASRMSIQIPAELLEHLTNSSDPDREYDAVRVISALYYNVEQVFPSEKTGMNRSVLGSGIVSTGLQCGDNLCDNNNNLTRPVIITIEHSTALNAERKKSECVFWKFIERDEKTLLTMGEWSDIGCSRNATLSNGFYTVCECDHLTHFAILLSPVPLNRFPPGVKLSLQVIGYVGVSISLIAMAITAATFIVFKSLHNMRNYIHIHLCISLMMAQLIFVVGIDKSAEDHVPVHCQAIAVLLHYFFLVSFMWMLMEGVVLYVVLVLIFAKHTKLYMLGFTFASYGIPILYIAVTLPLGFAIKDKHYGYEAACFLNPETHFIWAFIAPVIVIIVVNFVLFLIVARVMWKHQKRRTDKSKIANVRRWLRSAVFLVVIMGLTWVAGVLILEVEALLPLAYIFTIMVAFQGLAIFLIFVPFSKQVRDTFRKWWKAKVNDSTLLTRYFGESILSYGSNLKSSNQSRKTTLPSRYAKKKRPEILTETITKEMHFRDSNKRFEGATLPSKFVEKEPEILMETIVKEMHFDDGSNDGKHLEDTAIVICNHVITIPPSATTQ